MAEKKAVPEQPTEEEQALLKSIETDKADTVMLRGRKIKMRWLKNCTRSKITDIILNEKEETRVGAKCAAAVVLNGYFGLLLWYGLLWRWYYYVKQYTDEEYMPLMMLAKKKAAAENYFLLTTLLIGMKDTMMMMTRAEVERFLRERK